MAAEIARDRCPVHEEKNSMMRLPGDRGVWGRADRDLEPVSMVRKVNPYADVPSLYDLYVQAASRDRQPDRFGMEVFRNGTREQDAIPMDLPVGPDYVVGPGDGLSINLGRSFAETGSTGGS
jgi:hypothetical protein